MKELAAASPTTESHLDHPWRADESEGNTCGAALTGGSFDPASALEIAYKR